MVFVRDSRCNRHTLSWFNRHSAVSSSAKGLTVPGIVVKMVMRMIRGTVTRTANFNIRDLCPIKHADRTFIPALFVAGLSDDFIQPHHRCVRVLVTMCLLPPAVSSWSATPRSLSSLGAETIIFLWQQIGGGIPERSWPRSYWRRPFAPWL